MQGAYPNFLKLLLISDGYKIIGDKIVEDKRYVTIPSLKSPTLWDKEKSGARIEGSCNEKYVCKMSILNKKLTKTLSEYDAKISKELQKIKDNEAKQRIEKGLNDL
ncbi:MAG: hypothetical protein LBD84_01700 [Campylobacteraceae bacterium]|jgi:hypothetical protein|nr:hypothetical protein [Campylobacteraceae bacterium]